MEPMTSVLLNNTTPRYKARTTETAVTTIRAGLLVHRSTAEGADNDVNLCDARYGNALNTEESLEIVEIVGQHRNLPLPNDKTNAYPASTGIKTHELVAGDELYVKTSGTIDALDTDDIVICAANGLVSKGAASTTADEFNVHAFQPLYPHAANSTWVAVRYVGVRAIDAS